MKEVWTKKHLVANQVMMERPPMKGYRGYLNVWVSLRFSTDHDGEATNEGARRFS